MSIARVARGTASGKGIAQLTISAVTCAAGSSLEVGIAFDTAASDSALPTWGGIPMTLVLSDNLGGGSMFEIYRLDNVSAGTHDVVTQDWFANWDSLAGWAAMGAVEITGPTAAPQDQLKNAPGSGTSPDSGNTGTTSQADELLMGWIGVEGPSTDASLNWGNSFSTGQRIGTSGGPATANATLAEGYRVVSAAGAYAAAGSLTTSRAWNAAIVTHKAAAVAGGPDILTVAPVALQGLVSEGPLATGLTSAPIVVAQALVSEGPLATGVTTAPLIIDSTLEVS